MTSGPAGGGRREGALEGSGRLTAWRVGLSKGEAAGAAPWTRPGTPVSVDTALVPVPRDPGCAGPGRGLSAGILSRLPVGSEARPGLGTAHRAWPGPGSQVSP